MKKPLFFYTIVVYLLASQNYSIAQAVRVTPGTKITIDEGTSANIPMGNFILLDDQSSAPSMLEKGSLATSSGDKEKIQKWVSEGEWYIIGNPLMGAVSSSYSMFDLYEYLEPLNSMNQIESNTIPLLLGKGYFLWTEPSNHSGVINGPFLATLTGNFNKGSIYVPLSFTATGQIELSGWNLLGNPFPCSLLWNAQSDWNRANVEASVYHFGNPTGENEGSGNYNVYNYYTKMRIPVNNMGIIAATQGFWVKAREGSAHLTIPASQRTHYVNTLPLPAKEDHNNLLRITVQGINDDYYCETIVAFLDEGSAGFDGMYDAHYLPGVDEAPALYTTSDEIDCSINVLSDPDERQVVPLHFIANDKINYTLTFSNVGSFPSDLEIILEDLSANTLTNITKNLVYLFPGIPGSPTHRFNIHFTYPYEEKDATSGNGILIYSANSHIYVILPTDEKEDHRPDSRIIIYSILGQPVHKLQTSQVFNIINMEGREKCPYIVNVLHDHSQHTKKVFVY